MLNDNLNDIIRKSIESATHNNYPPASNVLIPGDSNDALANRIANNRGKRGRPRKNSRSAWMFADPFEDSEEELLLRDVKATHEKRFHYHLSYYYKIGQLINAYFSFGCPGDILRIIKERTGVGMSSLQKACQFARIYTQATYDMLIGGPFLLTWFQIAQNLTVEPQLLVEIYRNSKSKYEFNEKIVAIKRLKKQGVSA